MDVNWIWAVAIVACQFAGLIALCLIDPANLARDTKRKEK